MNYIPISLPASYLDKEKHEGIYGPFFMIFPPKLEYHKELWI